MTGDPARLSRRAVLAAAAVLPIAACGRKSSLRLPEGETGTYPRDYPAGSERNDNRERRAPR